MSDLSWGDVITLWRQAVEAGEEITLDAEALAAGR